METDLRLCTIHKVIDETEWITAEVLTAVHLEPNSIGYERISDWKRGREIFSVEIGTTQCFARYQFDESGRPLPVIREILTALGPVGDFWRVAAWFHFSNGWLTDPSRAEDAPQSAAPKDVLQRSVDVIEAARKSRATYWA